MGYVSAYPRADFNAETLRTAEDAGDSSGQLPYLFSVELSYLRAVTPLTEIADSVHQHPLRSAALLCRMVQLRSWVTSRRPHDCIAQRLAGYLFISLIIFLAFRRAVMATRPAETFVVQARANGHRTFCQTRACTTKS